MTIAQIKSYSTTPIVDWVSFIKTFGYQETDAEALGCIMKLHDELHDAYVYSFGVYRQMAQQVLDQAKAELSFCP